MLLATSAAAGWAHDTWFALRSAQLPGNTLLALGTGNQFPVHESSISAEYLQHRGCRQAGRDVGLTPLANTATSLLVRAQPATAEPLTCWAQLVPFEIVIAPDKVALYLDEINASPSLRQTWAGMNARGVPWKERYVKHARVEIAAAAAATADSAATTAAASVPMSMDVVLQSGLQPLRSGDRLVFQVLRDGSALPGFPIELRGESPAQARWLRTDDNGRVAIVAPEPGAWVLRGTDLRLSNTEPGLWESRFVTLAFRVSGQR